MSETAKMLMEHCRAYKMGIGHALFPNSLFHKSLTWPEHHRKAIPEALNELVGLGLMAEEGDKLLLTEDGYNFIHNPHLIEPLAKRKHQRLEFLKTLYAATDGRSDRGVSMWELGKSLGFSGDETQGIYQYLQAEGLAKAMALGGTITITQDGVRLVEGDAPLAAYGDRTYNTVNIGGNVVGSAIQQDAQYSSQQVSTVVSSEALQQVEKAVAEIESKLSELELAAVQRGEMEAEIATCKAQLKSPKPKATVLRESLATMRNIVEGCVGSLAASGLLNLLATTLAMLG